MALIKCEVCNNDMADNARSCPGCGAPNKIVSAKNKAKLTKIAIGTVIILALVIIIILTKNMKPSRMSEEVYNLGLSALNIADEFLDNKRTADEAYLKLDYMYSRLEELDDTDAFLVHTDILILSHKISDFDSSFSSTTIQDVVQKRNELADRLNQKKR